MKCYFGVDLHNTQAEKAGAEVTVINTMKFKVINESTKKTDRHDASG